VDCGLTPFVDALPIPPALAPTGTREDGVLQYTVEVVDAQQQLHSELPDTDVWTYNGAYPSFTIEATVGVPIEVTYINNLPTARGQRGSHLFEVDQCPHGPNYYADSARISTHLHGGHVPARVDGQPELTILPGETDVFEYPNNQEPATLWYHDHALGITRLNVYSGMAGYYLLRDDFETNLGLPSGEFEIPVVIQDRTFNPDGSLFYPPTITNAFRVQGRPHRGERQGVAVPEREAGQVPLPPAERLPIPGVQPQVGESRRSESDHPVHPDRHGRRSHRCAHPPRHDQHHGAGRALRRDRRFRRHPGRYRNRAAQRRADQPADPERHEVRGDERGRVGPCRPACVQ
jgi:FtsP/CotA-like multicopper oxidase with cupredoxin domain